MKIGLISASSFALYGGIQKHIFGLYKEFKKRGHQVKIFVPKVKIGERYKNKDICLIGGALNIQIEATGTISFGFSVKGCPFDSYFTKNRFDILHFHNPPTPFLSWQILNSSKTVNVATFHADLIDNQTYEKYSAIIKNVYESLLPKIHGFIAVSKSAEHSLISVYPKAKVEIIPNGLDSDFFAKGKVIEKFKDNKFNLLYVGRFDERKGIPYLLESFFKLKKKFPKKLRLILVGDGPQRKEILEKIEELKIKRETVLTGEVKEKGLPDFYKTTDLFVAPATHGESFGLVLIEAMAAGVPIVAAANRGYRDVLKEIGRYSLVPPGDSKKMAEKITAFIKDEKLREKMRNWGREEVKKYSWEGISERVLEFYKQILKNERKLS